MASKKPKYEWDWADYARTQLVLSDVSAERQRQDAKWGGPEHDDEHTVREMLSFIEDKTEAASDCVEHEDPETPDDARAIRKYLIQVAALAVATVEAIDRQFIHGRKSKR